MPDGTDERYHHGNLRAALLAAAEQTTRESGVDALSLRDLARQVGVSHAAPRRHFPDRQSLLDALAVNGFQRIDTELRTAVAGAGDDFVARLKALAQTYTRFATRDAALLELMFSRKHGENADVFMAAAQPSFALMEDLLREGQEQGVLRDGPIDQVGIVLFATMHGIAAMTNGHLAPPELLEGLANTAVEQFVRGAARA
ncbi:TetR/AcrR family transcriptional regulator [Kineosporia sp. NBRC 101731]|uniref:TetR/AcrR family transcriptional regulator n=1 Tax=Kineosporia sp. NBRC 101731 TaxID=3032199 RepID=UPI0024A15A0D|nr:TetR/AcrR family transcriptional regulator [Kineosporia sp. NBRC 101731]GLY28784.1 TetR family transcriptional regulator [Kineosporia sp. NBRC 101731]